MTSQKPRDRPCGFFGDPPTSAGCNQLTDMVVQSDECWLGTHVEVPVCPAHAAQVLAAVRTVGASAKLLQWTSRQVTRWGMVELDPTGYRGAACWPPVDELRDRIASDLTIIGVAEDSGTKPGWLADRVMNVIKQDYFDPGDES